MIDTACFGGAFRGRTVLVTGHTGFKGSWLALWLTALGAKVVGYSAYLPSDPCNFSVCGLERSLIRCTGDIRDLAALEKVLPTINRNWFSTWRRNRSCEPRTINRVRPSR